MRKRRAAAAVALAAALVVPLGGAAEARHRCTLEDPVETVNCPTHGWMLYERIVCLLLERC